MTFLFIILILLLGASGYLIFMYSKKNNLLKKQVLLLSRQNDSLRTKFMKNSEQKPLTITYHIPEYKWGVAIKDGILYISPLETSSQITNLTEGTKVYIIDSAEINSEIWFYVSINSNNNVNNKGWLKEEFISLMHESTYNGI